VLNHYPWKEASTCLCFHLLAIYIFNRQVKRNIEALYKRVNKHFSDEEGLLQVVWHGIQEEFIRDHNRTTELMQKCYAHTGLSIDFTINDLLDTFSELAKNNRRR
jgi:hemerythrin